MASVEDLPRRRRLILDAGGVFAVAIGSTEARTALHRLRREGFVVVIPTPVLAQVHRAGHDRARIDRVVNAIDGLLPTSGPVARLAGELQGAASTNDAIVAIVAAEALTAVPAIILTSDAEDMARLIQGHPNAHRVLIIRV